MFVKLKPDTKKSIKERIDKISRKYLIEKIYNRSNPNLNLISELREEYKNTPIKQLEKILNNL